MGELGTEEEEIHRSIGRLVGESGIEHFLTVGRLAALSAEEGRGEAFPDKDAAFRETCRVLKKGGIFCGCFYVAGEFPRTDFFVRHFYVRKGFFTPPFETKTSLESRLRDLYDDVSVRTVNAEGIFRCRK